MSARLSVIVPTYQRAVSTVRAVDSALAQSVDLEVVVVDDGSAESFQWKQADSRVRVVRLGTNRGAAAARNAGVAAARSDWIAFLDSDDVWPVDSLAPRFEAALATAEHERVIWCGAFTDVQAETRLRTRFPRASSSPQDFASGCWSCPGSTALMSRAAWMASGGQDEELRRLEDYEWLFRWGLAGGELRSFPGLAAEINRGAGARVELVQAAVAHILGKHRIVSDDLRIRMKSYLALEVAASRLRSGAIATGLWSLAHSWILRPRGQIALEQFWRIEKPD